MAEPESAAYQDPRRVPGLARRRTRLLGQQRRQPPVDPLRGSGRQIRVEARAPRRPGEFRAQRVPVGGPVDGPVEGPPAAVDHLGQRRHRGQIRPPVRREKTQDELLGALRPQRRGLLAERRHLTGREAVGGPQHHPQWKADGRPDRRERGPGRGEPVGRHVRHQLQTIGPMRPRRRPRPAGRARSPPAARACSYDPILR